MMNIKTLFIFFMLFAFFRIAAQTDLDIQRQYADSLFSEHKYFDAITEYKRLLFFDKEKKFDFLANFKIGLAYKNGGKYEQAIKFFKFAEKSAVNPEDRLNISIWIARTNILRGTTEIALDSLNNIASRINDSTKLAKINYWKGWAFMFADQWDSAKTEFEKIDTNHVLARICKDVINQKYSVTFAKLISYILPGAGQFYTGHYVSGLMSLGMNVLWGYLTVNAFLADRVFDGIVIGNLLWFRFYRGNYQNAEKFALQKNIRIANIALRKVQIEYKGEKP